MAFDQRLILPQCAAIERERGAAKMRKKNWLKAVLINRYYYYYIYQQI